jgi:hypothetical protein
VPIWIKSDIEPTGCSLLLGNFDLGIKDGKVGIQAIVQIGKSEEIETWRQAPAVSKGLHF